jgi:uncharacterized damage-inducible protein DinB
MPEFQHDTIDKMFEFNLWTNIELIKVCQPLDDEQLAFEVDGAYGGIRSFLKHIVMAEGFYITQLTGTKFWDGDLDWENLPLDIILERARLSGQRLIEIAKNTNPNAPQERKRQWQPQPFFNWTLLIQAICHGVEHRTHVKVLLSHLDIEHPVLDVWEFTESLA